MGSNQLSSDSLTMYKEDKTTLPYLFMPNPKPLQITERWAFRSGDHYAYIVSANSAEFQLSNPPVVGTSIQLIVWDMEENCWVVRWFCVVECRRKILPGLGDSLLNETIFIINEIDAPLGE